MRAGERLTHRAPRSPFCSGVYLVRAIVLVLVLVLVLEIAIVLPVQVEFEDEDEDRFAEDEDDSSLAFRLQPCLAPCFCALEKPSLFCYSIYWLLSRLEAWSLVMRRFFAIFLLMPLSLCANVQKTGDSLQDVETNKIHGISVPNPSPSALTPQPSALPSDTWTPPPFSRFEEIINRKPFGQPAPAASAAASAAAAAAPPPPPAFVAKLTLCAINRSPSGAMAVGFVDATSNPPCSHYIDVGDTQDGYTAIAADIDRETATICRDGVNVDLSMSKGPQVVTAIPAPVSPAQQIHPMSVANNSTQLFARTESGSAIKGLISPLDPSHWPVPANVKAIDAALKMGIKNESYLDRLKQRREEVLAQQITDNNSALQNAANLSDDKVSAAFESMLRRRNLELIRKGEPGLGFPLTAEEDAQLVHEGILPAQ